MMAQRLGLDAICLMPKLLITHTLRGAKEKSAKKEHPKKKKSNLTSEEKIYPHGHALCYASVGTTPSQIVNKALGEMK